MGEKLRFKILGIFDASHAYAVERVLRHKEGIRSANLSSTLEELTLIVNPEIITRDQIVELITGLGYQVRDAAEEEPESIELARTKELHSVLIHFISSIILTIPVVLWSYFRNLFPSLDPNMLNITILGRIFIIHYIYLVIFIFTTVIIFVSGSILFKGAYRAIKHRTTNMDGLISLGIVSIYVYSVGAVLFSYERHYFDTAALLVSFLLFGRLLESKIRWQETGLTRRFTLPQKIRVQHRGKHESVPMAEVKVGQIVVVEPDEIIPVDGEIIDGYSIVDESVITGENIPREKKEGNMVFAASRNTTGNLLVRVERIGDSATIANISRLVSESHHQKSEIQKLADKTAMVYVPMIIVIGVITFIGWYLNHVDFIIALSALASIFVVGTPSTLALAIPTAILIGMKIGVKNGILFRTGVDIEKLSKVNTVILSKEGIVTERKYHLNETIKTSKSKEDPLSVAYQYLSQADTPLANAVVDYVNLHKRKFKSTNDKKNKVEVYPNGVISKLKRKQVTIGDKSFLLEHGVSITSIEANILHYEVQGKTVWIISHGTDLIGLLILTSPLRDFSLMTALELKKAGYEVFLSSTDSLQTTQAVANDVGIDRILANMTQDKLTNEISRLQEEKRIVAYVTDDNEETEALSQADVGITMGDFANVSASASDAFLFKNDPREVLVALQLARTTFKRVKMNIFWSIAYNTAAVPIAAGVLYPFIGYMVRPEIAASMMVLSSISILLSSVSLKRYVPDIKKFDVVSFRK